MGLVHLPLLVPVFSQGRSRSISELVCWRAGGSVMGLGAGKILALITVWRRQQYWEKSLSIYKGNEASRCKARDLDIWTPSFQAATN